VIEMGKKYTTRDGRAVRVLATDLHATRTVLGVVTDVAGYDLVFSWYPDGSYYEDGKPDPLELVSKHEGYGVIRMKSRPNDIACIADGVIWDTRQEAEHYLNEMSMTGAILAYVTWED